MIIKKLMVLGFMTSGLSMAGDFTLNADDLSHFTASDREVIIAAYPELVDKNVTQGAAVVATIGFSSNCTFNASVRTTPIQDAIDFTINTYTELRLVEGVYDEENITLNDRDMVIKGGYASCPDAANNIQTSPNSLNTIIQSSTDSNPVFRIDGNTGRNFITLQNLAIKNSGASNWYGGAIRINSANASISLYKIALSNNTAWKGGAIGITGNGGDMNVNLRQVQMNANQAEAGGGIYCRNPNAQINIFDSDGLEHGIYSNTATAGSGGGILLENGCEMITYQGSQDVQLFGSDMRGINFNTATEHGGGIAIMGGAKATLRGRNSCFPLNNNWICLSGNNDEPVSMLFNFANYDDNGLGNGGAVYVDGVGSELVAENVYMMANMAFDGGAVAAENGATVTIKSAFENEAGAIGCWNPGACVDLNTNFATSVGGGLYAATGADIDVANSALRGHRATAGVVGYARDSGSKIKFEGSVFFNNGSNGTGNYNDTYLFRAFQSSEILIYYSTIGENQSTSRIIGNNDARVGLANSIVYDPDGVDIYLESGNNNPTRFMDCLILHEDQSVVATRKFTSDPMFMDTGNQDYRLKDGSPGIDMCNQQWVSPLFPDMLGSDRPVDLPEYTNLYGAEDVGAYEATATDIIFKDDFE
ncbi:hypothetical protein [Marinicella gelatinilytica]|uniref:hypothetical protein n=1 Tax=Marinicella gelatinilytica TaxID=2996017 RepID=UPI002260CAC8|nr:hypothetical protein [Marinicella gelatinilytica]MCX7545280.1 hypothetical protein [Marinicella gelatinilytica]